MISLTPLLLPSSSRRGVACLPVGRGVRFLLQEKMIFSFPKYHFYPEVSGQAILHSIFYILHFPQHKDTKAQKPRRTTKAFLNFYFWILFFLTTNSRIDLPLRSEYKEFTRRVLIHEKMTILYPPIPLLHSIFYIQYFTFDILHFFSATKAQRNTKAFSFPKWLLPPSGDWGGFKIKRAHGINPQALLFCISVSDFRLTF
jgi:hypothetical protein